MSSFSATSLHYRDDKSSGFFLVGGARIYFGRIRSIRKTVISKRILSCLTLAGDWDVMNLKVVSVVKTRNKIQANKLNYTMSGPNTLTS